MIVSPSAETRLLLACLGDPVEFLATNQSAAVSLDWSAFVAQAESLGLTGLLHSALKHSSLAAVVPAEVLQRLKTSFYFNQVQNMKLYLRLKEVLHRFGQSGIETIVLKGAALAALTYPQMGLRPMGDADLLLRSEDLDAAEHLLMEMKFRALDQSYSKEWYRTYHHHLAPYISDDNSLAVELHRHIVSPNLPVALPIDGFWQRSRAVTIVGIPCRILSPEDAVLHLSLHMANDSFVGKMRVLIDIREIIHRHGNEINWQSLMGRAADCAALKYLYYALLMARDMVGANIPEGVLHVLVRHTSRVPFVDQILKVLIRGGLVIHEEARSPWTCWILQNAVPDLLSEESGVKKLANIACRIQKVYEQYARAHAQVEGASPRKYSIVQYPLYLFSKAVGLQEWQCGRHKKSM